MNFPEPDITPVYLTNAGGLPQRQAQIFSLTTLLSILVEQRRLVRTVWLAVITLTLVYVAVRKPLYSATASLMPPDSSSSSAGLASLLASNPAASAVSASGLLPGLKQPGELFVGVLESRTVQELLVHRFHLESYYRARDTEDACRRLSANSAFVDNVKSGIVTITVEDHDPKLAAALANAYAGALDTLLTRNSTSAAGRERAFLEERLGQIKKELDVSSHALSTYASKNRTIDIPLQAKATVETGMRLNTELASAKSDLVALRQTYSSDNARVRATEASIAELQRQISQINGRTGSETAAPSSGYPSITALPILALTYTDLQRRAMVDEALWSALTKQYEAAKVQEAKEIPTVRVLDAAQVPVRKANMNRIAVLSLGVFSGLLTGIAAAVTRSLWSGFNSEQKRLILSLFRLSRA